MGSLPQGLAHQSPSPIQESIADRWLQLLDEAEHSVNIAAYLSALRSSAKYGEASTDQLVSSFQRSL